MNENKELIEVWRKEFESSLVYQHIVSKDYSFKRIEKSGSSRNGEYQFTDMQFHWEGFLVAKRAQPSVVLPEPEDMYDKGDAWMGRFFADGYIHNALTAAGIKYTIGE